MKKVIKSSAAPAAIGPYSQAIRTGNLIFTAGQIAISPQSGEMIQGGVADQTKQVLDNLTAIIEEAGATLASVVRTTVYLTRPDDFAPMNEVYGTYFSSAPPARVTVFVGSLPRNALVEIDAIVEL
jgi:2-iminobutanoate/2-iminopropanoate deaminase